MSKLIIITNHQSHAQEMVIEKYGLNLLDCKIVTPEKTHSLYGYKDFDYYCIRPMYAREHKYVTTHGGVELTLDEVIEKYARAYCLLCKRDGHWTRDCPDMAEENRI